MVGCNSVPDWAVASGTVRQVEVFGDGYVEKLIGKGFALDRSMAVYDQPLL